MDLAAQTLEAMAQARDQTDGSPAEKRYQQIVRVVRELLERKVLTSGSPLPTEAQLMGVFRVSRQTVRRAMDDLAREGVIYRVAGRGTFVSQAERLPSRQFVATQDVLSSTLDAQYELVEPMSKRIDISAAGRLQLPTDIVACASFRRIHEGVPFGYTEVYMPPNIGELLSDVEELQKPGSATRITVVELLDERLEGGIVAADQSITATALPAGAAAHLGREEGDLALQIDLVYFDANNAMVELQSSYFLPQSYSHRSRLQRATLASKHPDQTSVPDPQRVHAVTVR